MSDPVTNIEIEDVLSSIRRLVSDEARAAERGEKELSFSSDVPPQSVELEEEKSDEVMESTAPKAAPALVLTAALRIVPEHENTAEKADLENSEPEDEGASDDDTLILTQVHSDDDTGQVFAEQAEAEQNVADDHAVDTTEDTHESEVSAQEEHDAPAPEMRDDAEADNEDQDATPEEPVTIEDKIAALEALISGTDSEFEPDGAEQGGNAARRLQLLPWEDSSPSHSGLQTGALPDPEIASQAAAFHDTATAFERARTEAVETAQAELSTNASETLLENEEIASVVDEEALRDMVSEIVRQELQGPLGERITRNVRKLVRREIYRALAANELD